MNRITYIAAFVLRIVLGLNFLSAVMPRLGMTGRADAWNKFLEYTAEVNAFAPPSFIPVLAAIATTLEIVFAILLLAGWKTRFIALASSILLLTFALAMSVSLGIRSAFDYSVFVDSAAAFLLASLPEHASSLKHYRSRSIKKLNI